VVGVADCGEIKQGGANKEGGGIKERGEMQ
jgi:hypothetical protein